MLLGPVEHQPKSEESYRKEISSEAGLSLRVCTCAAGGVQVSEISFNLSLDLKSLYV